MMMMMTPSTEFRYEDDDGDDTEYCAPYVMIVNILDDDIKKGDNIHPAHIFTTHQDMVTKNQLKFPLNLELVVWSRV